MGWDDNVHVPVRTQARQPHQTRAGGGSLSLFLPNPPKRTSPAWSAWVGVGWGGGWNGLGWGGMITSMLVCAHRHGNLIKTKAGGGSLSLSLPGAPFCPLSGPNPPKRTPPAWSAWLRQNGPPLLFQPHRSLSLSLPGAPFFPLSGPNPPKRSSPAGSAWLCSLLSLWWSVLEDLGC